MIYLAEDIVLEKHTVIIFMGYVYLGEMPMYVMVKRIKTFGKIIYSILMH